MFQTPKSRDQVVGSGMELALVKKTVDSIGCNIAVESITGVRGTRVVFQLPHMFADE
jgi:signal transduction histidine kinase